MTLLKRIIRDKRVILLPLALLLVANVLVYALVEYPLVRRSAGAASRATAATAARQAAERDFAAAQGLVSGKSRAQEELATFYNKVLPANFVAASRPIYARLPALAKTANVRYEASTFEVDPTTRNERVGRLHTKWVLQGDYENLRRFIFDLETSPEFVIIDGVTLAQAEPGKPTTLDLELSTYYRVKANGT
jgi:Type II secretion system (T2SS), protein M subtype b